jgi:hypothetical protein
LFRHPGVSYSASIRTAHASFDPDSDPKVSSIAMKVHAPGLGPRIDISDYPRELQDLNKDKQDFVFISADSIFLGAKVLDIKTFHEYQMWGGIAGIMMFLVPRPTAFFGVLRSLLAGQSITVPFLEKHNTIMSARFGDNTTAAKFILKPCIKEIRPSVPSGAKYFVTKLSNEYVLRNGVCMNMFVQLQVDSCKTPIETTGVVWDESIAPLQKIAQFTVAKGTIGDKDCEFTTFNPWYGLEEHRPLGFMGRIRKGVYREGALLRMKKSSSCPFFKN